MQRSQRIRKSMHAVLVWSPLAVVLVWTLLPLMWSFSASFKPLLELYVSPPKFIPRDFTFENYQNVFQLRNFGYYFANSVLLATVSTLMTVVVSTLAAYAFARYMFPLRHILLLFVLVPRILPRVALVIPLYRLFAAFGILDTYAALLISYTASAVPLSTWILTGFIKGIPESMEESARLDGANLIQILYKIVLPMAIPGLVSVVIVAAVQSWNEFPFVLAFTSTAEMRTLPYALYLIQDAMGMQDWSLINAFSMVTIIPIVAVFLVFQRRVISGIVRGSVK